MSLKSFVVGAVTGGATGAKVGTHIGIATGGIAIAGTIPLAIGGAIIGGLGADKVSQSIKK